MTLSLRNIEHRYGDNSTLRGVSLELEQGRIGCLLGPSGCGKTTLLRCVAGFEHLHGGEIRAMNQLLSTTSAHVPPEHRHIGMVFQDYALLPHLTVRRNVLFGLSRLPRAESESRLSTILERLNLTALADRYPHEISGGQQQRVAIARALAPEPSLLLMDEPFSNLDAGLRESLGVQLRELLHSMQTTALIVTHDHNDAFSIADDAGVLRDGQLLQWDEVYELYHRPRDRFVADFAGHGTWLPAQVRGVSEVEFELGSATGVMTREYAIGSEVDLLLRSDDVVHDDASPLMLEVTRKQFRGPEFIYHLRLPSGGELLASVPSHHNHDVGDRIGIRIETEHMVVFDRI